MITITYLVVMLFIGITVGLAWLYFDKYHIARPPVGVFGLTDLIILCVIVIVTPYLYIIFPLWLAGILLTLVTFNFLYLFWEAIFHKRGLKWGFALGFLLLDIGAAFLFTTSSNIFFLMNNVVLVMAIAGLVTLWAQSGMRASHVALMAIFLTGYDFIATSQLPLMTNLLQRLSALPFAPILAWKLQGSALSVGLGDLLMTALFPVVMKKAFGQTSGIIAMAVGLVAIGVMLFFATATTFPAMVVLGPLIALQYGYWRLNRGKERSMKQYLANA